MSRKGRYVFDTNVLISALMFNSSVPGRAFARASAEGVILISEPLVEELNDVLGREKFRRYMTIDERERFLESLIHQSELVEIRELVRACRDPADDHILELAINGCATGMVTGDPDLLVLNPFRGISIVPPARLLD